MDLAFSIIMFFTALLMAGLGALVKYREAYWLISGYNTMSEEEKSNVDVVGLANFIGNSCFFIAGILLVSALLGLVGQVALAGMVPILIIPGSIYMIIKSQKFDGNIKNTDGTIKRKAKMKVTVISTLLSLTFIGVGIGLYFSNQPTEYYVNSDYLEISGMYGEKIYFQDIEEISLRDSLPKIKYKSNGSAVGNMKKGHFTLEGLGSAKLFVDTSQPPFIYLKYKQRLLILNAASPEETRRLYEKVQAKVS